MKIDILTLFPNSFAPLKESMIGRAVQKNAIEINITDIREFSKDKHKRCDDYTFGGGEGMLMTPQPLFDSIESVLQENSYVIYLSPKGTVFSQKVATRLAEKEHLVFICGHYEGIDERVLEEIVTDYISIGDYVLTGGELAAMVMIDAISRLIPGVLHNDVSAEFESFQDNLLEYPQYTRPEEWHGKKVPEILLSGHHANVEKWRREQSIIRTAQRRPDLLEKAELTEREKEWLKSIKDIDL